MPDQVTVSSTWQDLSEKLNSYLGLKDGWDGYSAPPPPPRAVAMAKEFLAVLQEFNLEPTRVKPSVVGGIGITIRKEGRKGYIEFYGNGTACALFSDGESEPMTRSVQPTRDSYATIIREYLDA